MMVKDMNVTVGVGLRQSYMAEMRTEGTCPRLDLDILHRLHVSWLEGTKL